MFQESLKVEGCFVGVFRVFQMYFKKLKDVAGNFKGSFKEASRMFQGSFKGVSRKIQGCFKKDVFFWRELYVVLREF